VFASGSQLFVDRCTISAAGSTDRCNTSNL
jgi:hypothetical protein